MKKIISIVGARPQFIKAAVLSRKLRSSGFSEILIHSGQHYDFNMSDIFFQELELPAPDHHLGIGSGLPGEQTGRMLIEIEKVLLAEKARLVIVYGDTNTTLAGALAAKKHNIPIAHVEAGLRSFNRQMPEEANRVLTDHMSDYLFAPTPAAVINLKREGISKGIYQVGDVMVDLALRIKKERIVDEAEILAKFGLQKRKFILATIHRAENTDKEKNLQSIMAALDELARRGLMVFFPVHPRTRKALMQNAIHSARLSANLRLHEPVSYKEMLALEANAKVIVTDSGGMQKEGYFFKTPCVIPRRETEWVELIDNGWNILAGVEKNNIVQQALKAYESPRPNSWKSLYGNGRAADKICDIFKQHYIDKPNS